MSKYIDAPTLKAWLSDGGELALLDVRELGQYGLSHPFFAIPLAYSRLELRLRALVPNQSTRIAVYDDGAGVAEKAADAWQGARVRERVAHAGRGEFVRVQIRLEAGREDAAGRLRLAAALAGSLLVGAHRQTIVVEGAPVDQAIG